MPKINRKTKVKDLSAEQIVEMMMEVWQESLKSLTVEVIDLRFANHLSKCYEDRIAALEREVHKLKVKDTTSA